MQALTSSSSGLAGIGSQLGSRKEQGLSRDASSTLGAGQQLVAQQGQEQATRNAPIDRELQYLISTLNPLQAMSTQQQGRSQIPIDRQIQTALQAAPAFINIGQGESGTVKDIAQIASQERMQNQAINDAYAANNQRQQALVESIIFGPLGIMPSMIGSTTKSSGGGK
jgi:hypothetical protein